MLRIKIVAKRAVITATPINPVLICFRLTQCYKNGRKNLEKFLIN